MSAASSVPLVILAAAAPSELLPPPTPLGPSCAPRSASEPRALSAADGRFGESGDSTSDDSLLLALDSARLFCDPRGDSRPCALVRPRPSDEPGPFTGEMGPKPPCTLCRRRPSMVPMRLRRRLPSVVAPGS